MHMPVYDAASGGNRVTKAAFPKTAYTEPDPLVEITADVYESIAYDGAINKEIGRKTLFKDGDIVRQSKIDALYPAATFTGLTTATASPTTLPAAGGTVITIKGTNLLGVSSVTFGGTAGTALTLVDNETIRVTAPAKAAGVHAVVIVDDATPTLSAGNVTYV